MKRDAQTAILRACARHIGKKLQPVELRIKSIEERPAPNSADIVLQAAKLIPVPRDGKDGESVPLETIVTLIKAQVTEAVAALPEPKAGQDGKDGKDADQDAILAEVITHASTLIKHIPLPQNGKDGRDGVDGKDGLDGKDAVIDNDVIVKTVLASIPPPKNGLDGKSVSPDEIRLMVQEEVKQLPLPENGKDGKDGEDGTKFFMEFLTAFESELNRAYSAQ